MAEAPSVELIEQRLTLWLEREFGPVRKLERQARWRLAWIAEIERPGGILPLYVKGAREVEAPVPVKLEGEVMRVMYDNGVVTPRNMAIAPKSTPSRWSFCPANCG